MCDIYIAGCKGCGKEIDFHLADFSTGRGEVEVFCWKCTPSRKDDGVLWVDEEGDMVFVRSLTRNARFHADGNHPNAENPEIVEFFGMPRRPEGWGEDLFVDDVVDRMDGGR